VVSSL